MNNNSFHDKEKEVILLLSEILNKLNNIENIDEIININLLEQKINEIIPLKYYSIINDDVITLTSYINDINGESCHTFNIILNETKEKIGLIKFDYNINIEEYGNVFCEIYSKYRNKGYGTRSLKLLKEVVKNNQYNGNKDLYFYIAYWNKPSKKVVLKNDGEIINKGIHFFGKPYILKIKI